MRRDGRVDLGRIGAPDQPLGFEREVMGGSVGQDAAHDAHRGEITLAPAAGGMAPDIAGLLGIAAYQGDLLDRPDDAFGYSHWCQVVTHDTRLSACKVSVSLTFLVFLSRIVSHARLLAVAMDDKWFKAQQKKAGVTAEDIAAIAGKSRSNISHIYSGRQRMNIEWAKAFSTALEVPIDEVLRRAGVVLDNSVDPASQRLGDPKERSTERGHLTTVQAQQIRMSQDRDDAYPFSGSESEKQRVRKIAENLDPRDSAEVWTVNSRAMELGGLLPGDRILLDRNQSELCKAGDIVVASSLSGNDQKMLLRRYEPPVLVAETTNASDKRTRVVDGETVTIRGKVVAAWRKLP